MAKMRNWLSGLLGKPRKQTIDIVFPTSWETMTSQQFRDVCQILSSPHGRHETLFLCLCKLSGIRPDVQTRHDPEQIKGRLAFIIDGKRLKAVNQWYNKENARLQSIKDKQKFENGTTRRQAELSVRRNNRVNDYMSKTARKVIDYCIQSDIGTLVVGYNKGFQSSADLGKKNNQNFVNIPFGKLCSKLKYLCQLNGITYIEQEESYTSRASFFDKDDIPVYDQNNPGTYTFSGTRVHRGMYKTSRGYVLNADINGALNIMRKSNVVSLTALYNRGEVDTPVRIRIA